MTQYAYPFGEQGVSDEQYRRYARTYADTKVHEGLSVSANSTGMLVRVSAGFATVQGLAFYNDSTASVTIESNPAANPRIDTVVLRLDYATTPSIQLAVVKGVPRANPIAPTLAQTDMGVFEVPLADVQVPAGAVTVQATQVMSRSSRAYTWRNGRLIATSGRCTPWGSWTEQDPLRWQLLGESDMVMITGSLKFPAGWTSGWNPRAQDKVLNLPFPAKDWGWPIVVSTNDLAVCTLNFTAGQSVATLGGTTRGTNWGGTGHLFMLNGATYVADLG